MNKQHLELYTDYLFSTFGYATAMGFSRMVEGHVTHMTKLHAFCRQKNSHQIILLLPHIWKIKAELKEKNWCEINLSLQSIAYPI